jgi:hypothetical protein
MDSLPELESNQIMTFPPSMGWSKDPYDENLFEPMTMNLAENPKFDAMFPSHPLSLARNTLSRIQSSLHIAEEVKLKPRFTYPVGSAQRLQ